MCGMAVLENLALLLRHQEVRSSAFLSLECYLSLWTLWVLFGCGLNCTYDLSFP